MPQVWGDCSCDGKRDDSVVFLVEEEYLTIMIEDVYVLDMSVWLAGFPLYIELWNDPEVKDFIIESSITGLHSCLLAGGER